MSSDTVKNMNPINPSDSEQLIKQYLQAVKRELNCSKERKAQFLGQMHESALQYLRENPTATLANLTNEFGAPEEIAKSFLEEADPVVVGKSMRFGRKIFWAVLAIVAILAVVFASIYFADFHENQSYRRGHYVDIIEKNETAMSNPKNETTIIGVY